MLAGLMSYVADSGPAVHIAPNAMFTIHGWAITNSMVYGWIASLALIIFMLWVRRQVTVKPKGGVVQLVEAGMDFITNTVTGSFDDKERARKYVPYFVTLFFFLLLENWLGLIPGVGEAISYHHEPFLRSLTADWNATLAAAVVTMIMVYASSIRETSVRKYFRHFFVGSPLNPMYFFLGIVEMFTDLTRVISLSIRLFLNITIGEAVIAVFSYLGHIIAPVTSAPFVMLELFEGILQAYIFVILSIMYLAIAVNHISAHDEHEDLTEDEVPETMGLTAEEA